MYLQQITDHKPISTILSLGYIVCQQWTSNLVKDKCLIFCYIPQTLQCLSWSQEEPKLKELQAVLVQVSQLVHVLGIQLNLLSIKVLCKTLLVGAFGYYC